MAELDLIFCASHTPLMHVARDRAQEDQRARALAPFQDLRDAVAANELTALVIVANEHFTNFFLDHVPQLCIGTAATHFAPVEPWMGIEQRDVAGHPALARHLVQQLLAEGWMPSFSERLQLDHGIVSVHYELDDAMSLPLVPVIQNCGISPLLPPRHCFALGQALGRAVRSHPSDERVGLVGAGGLSHDIGSPRVGQLDVDFDQWFLDRLTTGDVEELLDLTEAEIAQAGNGAQEIRSWLVAAGAAWPRRGRLLSYEPVAEWITGFAVMDFPGVSRRPPAVDDVAAVH